MTVDFGIVKSLLEDAKIDPAVILLWSSHS